MIIVLMIFQMLIFFKIIVQYSCVVYNVKVIYIETKKQKNNHFIFYSCLPRQ